MKMKFVHIGLASLFFAIAITDCQRSLGDVDDSALDTVLQSIDDNASRLHAFRALIAEEITHTPTTLNKLQGSKVMSNGEQLMHLEYTPKQNAEIEILRGNTKIRYTRKQPQLETHTLLDLEGDVTTYVVGEYATVSPYNGRLLDHGLKYIDVLSFGSPPASPRLLQDFLRSSDVRTCKFVRRGESSSILIKGPLDSNSIVELWCDASAGYLPTEIATIWNSTGLYNYYASIDYDLVGSDLPETRFPALVICRRPTATDKFKSLTDQRWDEILIDKTTLRVKFFELKPDIEISDFDMPKYTKGIPVRAGTTADDTFNDDAVALPQGTFSRNLFLAINIIVVLALLAALLKRRFLKAS